MLAYSARGQIGRLMRTILETIIDIFDGLVLERDEALFLPPPFIVAVIVGLEGGYSNLGSGPGQSLFQHPFYTAR